MDAVIIGLQVVAIVGFFCEAGGVKIGPARPGWVGVALWALAAFLAAHSK